jgi:hypothetical protein
MLAVIEPELTNDEEWQVPVMTFEEYAA